MTRGGVWSEGFCSAFSIALFIIALNFSYALEARSSEIFDTAVRHYKEGNYLLARRRFEHLLRRDPNCWPAHYQLANTYMKLNEFELARREYELCLKEVDSATGAACRKAIAYIDATSRGGRSAGTGYEPVAVGLERENPSGLTGTARAGGRPAGGGSNRSGSARALVGSAAGAGTTRGARTIPAKPQTLEDRIFVVEPKFGHPAVDEGTVEMVKKAVSQLPSYVHSVLEKGGATINIAPNMTDRFPETLRGNMSRETFELAQGGGRCYGRDVYLYERSLLEGSKELGVRRPLGDMRNQVLHEIGHAVDDCLGNYSKTQVVLDLHSLDVSDIEPGLRGRLSYFTTSGPKGSMEACAELFSGFAGATGKDTDSVTKSFPRLSLWLRKKLDM